MKIKNKKEKGSSTMKVISTIRITEILNIHKFLLQKHIFFVKRKNTFSFLF